MAVEVNWGKEKEKALPRLKEGVVAVVAVVLPARGKLVTLPSRWIQEVLLDHQTVNLSLSRGGMALPAELTLLLLMDFSRSSVGISWRPRPWL